jgi:hypothetical protein
MDLPASDLYAVGAAVSKAWTRVIESHCYLRPLRYSAAVIAIQQVYVAPVHLLGFVSTSIELTPCFVAQQQLQGEHFNMQH